jgi:hypothetical protein
MDAEEYARRIHLQALARQVEETLDDNSTPIEPGGGGHWVGALHAIAEGEQAYGFLLDLGDLLEYIRCAYPLGSVNQMADHE